MSCAGNSACLAVKPFITACKNKGCSLGSLLIVLSGNVAFREIQAGPNSRSRIHQLPFNLSLNSIYPIEIIR